jgi:DNA-binding beta-propeller fold protein YncE
MLKISPNCWKRFLTKATSGCWFLGLAFSAHAAPLTAGTPILLPGTHGRFDFIRIDTAAHRLLLGHEGNQSFDVFDLGAKKLLKSVPTGTAQDAAVDVKRGNYYISGNDPGRMVIVSAKDLKVTGVVSLPAATDLIAFNPLTGLVHECNDTAAEEWLIDPVAKKVVTTIHFEGKGVEDLAFGPQHKRLFQTVKGANAIAVIDPTDNQVLNQYPLAPDTGPHGIAIVPDSDGLLAACSGKLVLLNCSTGKILGQATIAPGVDEMAYDSGTRVAYCASRRGEISVVSVTAGKLIPLGSVPDERGTGSIAVDPKTHTVWIAYHKGGECFVQPFTATK